MAKTKQRQHRNVKQRKRKRTADGANKSTKSSFRDGAMMKKDQHTFTAKGKTDELIALTGIFNQMFARSINSKISFSFAYEDEDTGEWCSATTALLPDHHDPRLCEAIQSICEMLHRDFEAQSSRMPSRQWTLRKSCDRLEGEYRC